MHVCVFIYKIIIHSAPTYIIQTQTFILDAINCINTCGILPTGNPIQKYHDSSYLKWFTHISYFFMDFKLSCRKADSSNWYHLCAAT